MAQNIALSQDAFGWADAFAKAFVQGVDAATRVRRQELDELRFDEDLRRNRSNEQQYRDAVERERRAREGLDGGGGSRGIGGADAPDAGRFGEPNLSPEEKALLAGIAGPESGQRYNVRYTPRGAATFDGFTDHPRIRELVPHTGNVSTAAGRYQFTAQTWDRLVPEFNRFNPDDPIRDFSPRNQDRAALFYARQVYRGRTGRDVIQDINDGRFDVRALSGTWTGLPGGREGNKSTGVSLDAWNRDFQRLLTRFRGEGKAQEEERTGQGQEQGRLDLDMPQAPMPDRVVPVPLPPEPPPLGGLEPPVPPLGERRARGQFTDRPMRVPDPALAPLAPPINVAPRPSMPPPGEQFAPPVPIPGTMDGFMQPPLPSSPPSFPSLPRFEPDTRPIPGTMDGFMQPPLPSSPPSFPSLPRFEPDTRPIPGTMDGFSELDNSALRFAEMNQRRRRRRRNDFGSYEDMFG